MPVTQLGLCELRLMNDARFPWLLLVPRETGMVELDDLAPEQQLVLWAEVRHAGRVLRQVAPCDKLNMGALGNIVRQLHVHVIARVEGDPAWPAPVWGFGHAQPYEAAAREKRLQALRYALEN